VPRVYLSAQLGLAPWPVNLADGVDAQIGRVFENLKAVVEASGGSLADVVKLNVYLVDLGNFAQVNAAMTTYFSEPFPARAAVGVAALPRGALVEVDGIVVLPA